MGGLSAQLTITTGQKAGAVRHVTRWVLVGIHSSEVDYLNCRLFCISQRQLAPHKLPDRSYIAIQTSFCDSIG